MITLRELLNLSRNYEKHQFREPHPSYLKELAHCLDRAIHPALQALRF